MKFEDSLSVLKHPVNTEKAVRMMELENKLTFIVDRRTNKVDIKKAIEAAFKVKVENVNTAILMDGTKKAYIKLSIENPAMDVATRLGLM
jgi:large subunit ribosomal protein L23